MRRILLTLALGFMTALLAWYGLNPYFDKMKNSKNNVDIKTATLLKPGLPLHEFSLSDTRNKTFNKSTLLGQWTVLFFGYSQCPDVCPRSLAMVSELWRLISNQPLQPQFVFVSLDPNEKINELDKFLKNFNPAFTGLAGSEPEIKKLAECCRAFSHIEPTLNEKGQKIISHSDNLILINPNGQLHAIFSQPHHPELIAKDLEIIMSYHK